jgi:hypothetical protein
MAYYGEGTRYVLRVSFCKNRTKVETGVVKSCYFYIKFVIYTYFKVSSQKISIRHNIDPPTWGVQSRFSPKSPKIDIFSKFFSCTFLKYFFSKLVTN